MKTLKQLREKTLTPAEKKKREEIAKAMEKDNPDMPMDKKMAIATAQAKKVAEGFTPKEIKMAIGIASDKRYAGGNMTGAVNQIEKIKKGLSNHKQVAAVLRRQNEEVEQIDEISAKLARKAAAASSAKSFEYGSSAYDDETQKYADHLDRKSDKAYAYIMKRQGQRGIDKTNRLASKLIFGKSRYMESVELDEELWKDIETYANKHGGIDKKDMLKVAMMLKKGDRKGAVKYARGLDTDPRDWLLDKMNEGLDEAMGPKPPKLKGNNGPYTRQQIEKAAKEAKVDMGAKARMMMKLRDMK